MYSGGHLHSPLKHSAFAPHGDGLHGSSGRGASVAVEGKDKDLHEY